MDHHLEDSLNLETAMGVDFEQPEDTIVTETGITLEHTTHEESIPMEFDHSDEQPILMDTSNEEIIVSDFMGDQFSLQEYSVQSDQTTGLTTTVESNQQHILSTQSDTMLDMQFQPHIVNAIKTEILPPKLIAVKTLPARPVTKKSETILASAPRQVAIAPKPPKLVTTKSYAPPKQLAIAPKPVSLVSSRGNSLVKKVSIAGVVQGNTKGNTVLAQIGKQLIMVPSGSQKIKLVSSTGTVPNIQYIRTDSDQAQLISTKSVSGSPTKPVLTKLFAVQGQPNIDISNQPAIITKLMPAGGPKSQPRFVAMQQKTMPITFGNKVLMATPSKQGVKLTKKQEIIAIKSPSPKLLPAPALVPVSSAPTKHKVIITPNTTKNVILKTTAPPKTAQVAKDGSMIVEKQKSQLHQINVPGKGIQYVRIFTNTTPTPKPAPKPMVALNSKTFVLTDSKGNLIQMTAEKMSAGQPPSLVVTGNTNTVSKSIAKPQKLVRIAPVVPKTMPATTQPGRSSQSLLAPLSPVQATDASLQNVEILLENPTEQSEGDEAEGEAEVEAEVEEEEVDSKAALRALIENAVSDDTNVGMTEIEIESMQHHSPNHDSSIDSMEQHDSSGRSDDHPFIVIPSKYEPQESTLASEDQNRLDDSQRTDNMINMDDEGVNDAYQSVTPAISEPEIVSADLGLRPRKACNCTKSQCLKLYCDCFANGEFCNRCNCVNCHNNLENEELRQKAIRGCLDRNPNAFRPKIGKAKIGGPEIIRRHNKGCNCKRSGCLKNYCECYEAKIACTAICKCVGCRNVEETLERGRHRNLPRLLPALPRLQAAPSPSALAQPKQPCSFMTTEVIEAVCQCLIAAAVDNKEEEEAKEVDPMGDVIEEFARCLQDIISAAHQSAPLGLVDEEPA